MSGGYNGWENKETWLVNLWIDNDGYAGGADAVAQEATDMYESAEGSTGYVTTNLAVWLQERIEDDLFGEGVTEAPKGLAEDLLRGALSKVNWEEIAEHYAEQAEADAAEGKED